ncbi:tRNA (adenosine(37)-N6)-threonylcarbamoyltransferase complex ATPase subunit type 1 TsaE [Mycobacterium hackensackense]|nr:tRNA (adenosine(37)-N6)-threonylcarbamoyltransferase complex ATPase subunit type 1 TsaE [Mycobacterium hackensackense]
MELGRRLGPLLGRGVLVSLEGGLGAGKTQLCKGLIAGAAGIDSDLVSSPAYTLVNHYPLNGGGHIVHIDFYRIDNLSVEDELLFDEALVDATAALIEWGDKFISLLAGSYLRVRMELASTPPDLCTLILDVVGGGANEHVVLDGWRALCELS